MASLTDRRSAAVALLAVPTGCPNGAAEGDTDGEFFLDNASPEDDSWL